MNPTIDLSLKAVAQRGDIDGLWTLIQENPRVLEDIDVMIPFDETPLHVAASAGHLPFATEIMRLKPSFARKLNGKGFSPIHLALQQGQNRMVIRFVEINKDLVRVKGKEGLTPLHLASQKGEINLLAIFLCACPDSIEDVTVRSETALHIAAKNGQYGALEVLVGWLIKTRVRDAMELEGGILNRKDEEGNTILHISAGIIDDSRPLQLLVKTTRNLNAKNLANSTALDIAAAKHAEEFKKILVNAGARCGSSVTDAPTLEDKLRSEITIVDKFIIYVLRIKDITDDQRNALLVVVALVATATYQSALSPPGGVRQANDGDHATATGGNAGTSVMSVGDFLTICIWNTLSFLLSTMTMYLLIPNVLLAAIVTIPLSSFAVSFAYSMKVISPTSSISYDYLFLVMLFLWFGAMLMCKFAVVYHRLPKEFQTRGGNVW